MTIINFYIMSQCGEADRRSRVLQLALMIFFLALFNTGLAQAQTQKNTSLVDRTDCSNISVDYRNNPNLTQQEKIELMDKALLESLNKYEGCQSRANAAGGGGGQSGGGSPSGGSQSGEGGGKGNGRSGASTASSEMTGTQTPTAQDISNDSLSGSSNNNSLNDSLSNKSASEAASMNDNANKHHQNVHLKGSGKTPGDIPPVDNDSILEAQIRQAAMNESDPEIKAKLWNEYRKYKGLPVQ